MKGLRALCKTRPGWILHGSKMNLGWVWDWSELSRMGQNCPGWVWDGYGMGPAGQSPAKVVQAGFAPSNIVFRCVPWWPRRPGRRNDNSV